MNKYIRTSYGIYEVSDVSYNEDIGMNQYISTDGDLIDSVEVVEEADTIKPLCDCWVYINKCIPNSTPKIYYDWDKLFFENQFEEELGIDRDECEVYGAIWTDKGLIYVARKMKEYGEWVLSWTD